MVQKIVLNKKIYKSKNCGMTIKFITHPNTVAKIIEAKMSTTAFYNKIEKSPDIPSLIAPKIFVPLTQKVTVTKR